ncbi:fungal pheromone mating factor STE2 GPCR-domain-containing protein [Lipomyces arxii]|uniref:fungal pheromone mating factor STE2 GPCR-domain-containing protein n=1 Tax=Lipomyces arxii TaxID=56418 RepID=UPI0034CF994E
MDNSTGSYPEVYNGIDVKTIDAWVQETMDTCVVFGVHIGSAAMVAILLALLTKPNKRKTPVFILNEFCLFLICVRAGLYIDYSVGPFNSFAAIFYNDYSQIPFQAYVRSAVTSVLQLFITLGVELSLLVQVRIVFDTHRRMQRIVTIVGSVFVFIVMAFWTNAVVQNVVATFQDVEFALMSWSWTAARALYVASISLFSFVFCYKLYLAIRQRRVLGLTEFGPLQVIAIMTLQTMIIPAILTIIQIAADFGPVMVALPSLLVVLSLPLSALWASATNDAIAASRRSGASNQNSDSNASNSSGYSSNYRFKSVTETMTSDSSNHDLEKQDDVFYNGPPVTISRTVITEQAR